jgi:hypothetical protein
VPSLQVKAWKDLIDFAENSVGQLVIPIRRSLLSAQASSLSSEKIAQLAGSDLLTEIIPLSSWACNVAIGQPLVKYQ